MGTLPSLVLVGAASLVIFVCVTVANTCNSVIWQSRVPPGRQGRVIGSIRTISFSTPPLAFELAGRGYASAHHGEAQWNGVAILSRVGLDDVEAAPGTVTAAREG